MGVRQIIIMFLFKSPQGERDKEMTHYKTREEQLAEQLHYWYLEAVSNLSKESYNLEAVKPYEKLTDEQKEIDRYIAKKIHSLRQDDLKSIREWVKSHRKSELYEIEKSNIENELTVAREKSYNQALSLVLQHLQ